VTQKDKEARCRANLQGEIDSTALYRALAEIEADPRIAEVYRRLAASSPSAWPPLASPSAWGGLSACRWPDRREKPAMNGGTMDLQEFTQRARRAGLDLDDEAIAMLFEEIAASCALMGEMAERVKARLATASEPAHLFRPNDAADNDRG
jgi:hypothetical protein